MTDIGTIIKCFRDDFDRFYDMLLAQIDLCPDALWVSKEGGYPFWQQIYHAIVMTELYSLPENSAPKQKKYSMQTAMLSEEPAEPMNKGEMKYMAEDIRQLAYDFMESLTMEKLKSLNPRISKILKKDTLYMTTMIALIRHLTYHIGCCDSILRNNGIKGVY